MSGDELTDNEPTVRYWRDPGSGITYPAADDTISGFYRDSRWTEVHVLTEAELAAHTTAARADALREFADMLDGAESYDVLSATKPDGVGWGEASVYDSIANSGPISDWLRIYAARTPDPNGDNT